MAPPGLLAPTRSGGSTDTIHTGSHIEKAIRAAHKALNSCGIDISPSKVNRIVRRFAANAKRHGLTFHEFLTDAANLTPKQRGQILTDPDLARVIAYLDPVGEEAVSRVLAARGF